MHQLSGLFGDGVDEARMGVTEQIHGDPRHEVEVRLSVGVVQHGTLAVRERDLVALEQRQEQFVSHDTTIVPTPESVKISSNSA